MLSITEASRYGRNSGVCCVVNGEAFAVFRGLDMIFTRYEFFVDGFSHIQVEVLEFIVVIAGCSVCDLKNDFFIADARFVPVAGVICRPGFGVCVDEVTGAHLVVFL